MAEAERRYRHMLVAMSTAYRWLSEFHIVGTVMQWLWQSESNHFRPIDAPADTTWPCEIRDFREKLYTMFNRKVIDLTPAEIQSGLDRVRWAERLIKQLPENHDGRNSWLLNYGSDAAESQKHHAAVLGEP